MGLRRSFFLLSLLCLAGALLLTYGVYCTCARLADRYPTYGVVITPDGVMTSTERPTLEQERARELLGRIQLLSVLLIPVCGLGLAGILFYRLKLRTPIAVLNSGTERIRRHDLDFSIPEVSADELGQICAAFETMRGELMRTNQELWRQAEERRRLNAAFAHDLRNPITVLKGTVKMLRQGNGDGQALERLEIYTLRIEQYVEAMSSIQRLEQMPVCRKTVNVSLLRDELQETAKLLAPSLDVSVAAQDLADIELDHGIFLTVAENLIGNAARFARERLEISMQILRQDSIQECMQASSPTIQTADGRKLILSVIDDGSGYPAELIKNGPRPFGKKDEDAAHFGMGLYSSQMLCVKHGGELMLENRAGGGAAATASFLCAGTRM
ncbi:MAG: HAMP domain-containing histidine kinase [Lachnospiraceae bacterium]|nr:HAMP domain-containing histidine kinase [Lachnospiraceae bacterium]